jgi:phosphinothricin acetyltransferase
VGAERAHPPYRLRLATPDDGAALADIYAPYVRETTISFELEAPSADEMVGRVAAVGEFHPWLVLELDGRVQAYAYASRWRTRPAYDWIAETSIYLARESVGRRIGEPLYRALLDLLALQGHWWAYGGIALPNRESQRFHARLAARGETHRGSSRRNFRPGREAETPLYRVYCKFRRQSPGRKEQARCREGFHHGLLGFEWLGCFPAVGYKFGRWCDLDWWRFRLAAADLEETPAPVRAIGDASITAAVGERLAGG